MIQAFNGEYFVAIDETIHRVRLLVSHELASKEFNVPAAPKKTVRKRIPPMTHPWRASYFKQYASRLTGKDKAAPLFQE